MSTLNVTLKRWLTWKLELSARGQSWRKYLLCYGNGSLKTKNCVIKFGGCCHIRRIAPIFSSSFYLFGSSKDRLRKPHCVNINVVTEAMKKRTTTTRTNIYQSGIETVVQHWQKCFESGEDNYIKKLHDWADMSAGFKNITPVFPSFKLFQLKDGRHYFYEPFM